MSEVYFQSPLLTLKLRIEAGGIVEADFVTRLADIPVPQGELEMQILEQLQHYCQTGQQDFDLPLKPVGTEFQQRVWRALQGIPTGEVRTYGELAQQLRSSARAVGNACRQNPIPLLIPCHRVVAKSGLGGFAGQTEGAQPALKQRLLSHEGVEIY